jgi:hypothetical protein
MTTTFHPTDDLPATLDAWAAAHDDSSRAESMREFAEQWNRIRRLLVAIHGEKEDA